ncbi:MAG: DUF4880 domain-containing protein [Alphaproteobacteria bacterium]|nr:DUF4880 domain-containing protein [Alphaproteobacteria bacterium]
MGRRSWKEIGEEAKQAAIAWHTRLSSGEAADADYEAFSDWLERDSANPDAFAAVELLAGRIEGLDFEQRQALGRLAGDFSSRPAGAGRRPLARFAPFAAMAAGLLALVAGGAAYYSFYRPSPQSYAAAADSFHTVRLSDGTEVILAPGAHMTAALRPAKREVTSFHGVGYFKVAHDTTRPFTIAFGDGHIRVVGTEFEVDSFSTHRTVAVARGVVAVNPHRNMKPFRLTAGDELKINKASPAGVVKKVAPEDVGSWRSGFLTFQDAGIGTVVERLNAFYGENIFSAADEDWSGASFSGILKLSDAEGTAHRLAELFPLEASAMDGGFVLKKRTSG